MMMERLERVRSTSEKIKKWAVRASDEKLQLFGKDASLDQLNNCLASLHNLYQVLGKELESLQLEWNLDELDHNYDKNKRETDG